MKLLLLFFFLPLLSTHKILINVPSFAKSSVILFARTAELLSDAGDEVHVVAPKIDKFTIKSFLKENTKVIVHDPPSNVNEDKLDRVEVMQTGMAFTYVDYN